jgi:hypothetical protein
MRAKSEITMRLVIMMAVLTLSLVSAHAQSDVWKHVTAPTRLPLRDVKLSDVQLTAIATLLRRSDKEDVWQCEGSELEEMIHGLTYESISLTQGKDILLVEAGPGCARGGQGSNGAMWLIRFEGAKPVLMASPKGEFSGWLYSVQTASSKGYRDIVLGWHMSALETDLTYFRFDGNSYVKIANATLKDGKIE